MAPLPLDPLEAGVRAVCAYMGVNPDHWPAFAEHGRAGINAFIGALPAELAEQLRRAMGKEPSP